MPAIDLTREFTERFDEMEKALRTLREAPAQATPDPAPLEAMTAERDGLQRRLEQVLSEHEAERARHAESRREQEARHADELGRLNGLMAELRQRAAKLSDRVGQLEKELEHERQKPRPAAPSPDTDELRLLTKRLAAAEKNLSETTRQLEMTRSELATTNENFKALKQDYKRLNDELHGRE